MFHTSKRGEFSCIAGGLVTQTSSGLHIRLPYVNSAVFRQFILYIYTGKV